jgi:hypothetical protein
MMSYEATMRAGARAYADILAALSAAGFPATFTQTGGMCAALEIQLEAGHTILITDAEDTLAWSRADHSGWGVGLYPPGDDWDDAVAYVQVDGSGASALLEAVRQVLQPRRP